MGKYYYQDKAEIPKPLEYHYNYMLENKIPEMVVFQAKVVKSEFSWCRHFETMIDEYSCGKKICEEYTPRNGTKGRCTFHGEMYEQSTLKKTLKLN